MNKDIKRVEDAYKKDKAGMTARLRAAGRTLEEAEDFVHDLYTETLQHIPVLSEIRNLSAWMNTLFKRRIIDDWRRTKRKQAAGETDIAEETISEIIAGTGLDPLDGFVRECLVEALNDAMKALPSKQKQVIQAQVFGGMSFAEIAETTGENIDTLKARKRYAVKRLSEALKHWIEA